MSTFGEIEIGKRSLMAQSRQIQTAGHNITNAGTEGFSRQRVNLGTFSPIYQPDLSRAETPGQIGQGVKIENVERVRDQFLDERIVAQTNVESYWATREKYYSMIEKIYNEPADISIRTNMDKFWDSWQELSVYPDSETARKAIVTRGESLVNSIHQRANSLSGIGTMLNNDIEGTVKQVNTYISQIAGLNKEIVNSKAMGDNPNDLLDKRDLMVDKLSSLINITVSSRDADEFNVYVDGQVLIQGNLERKFSVEPIIDDTGYSKVVWADTESDAHFSGGSLGALIELRDSDIRSEMQSLNTMTMNFADLVNDIHRNGVGSNNVTGLDFFVERPFVTNTLGNYDKNGDGIEDSTYIFRMTGTNSLNPQDQIGLKGEIKLSGKEGDVVITYNPADTIESIINRINNSESEVKAYLDKNNKLVLKATTAHNPENPDFVIRHVEDSGQFLAGYSGILKGMGEENAFRHDVANSVYSLREGAPDAEGKITGNVEYSVAPVYNPASYLAINDAILQDNGSIAAGYPSVSGYAEGGDGKVALEIASLRNKSVMIGDTKTFDKRKGRCRRN